MRYAGGGGCCEHLIHHFLLHHTQELVEVDLTRPVLIHFSHHSSNLIFCEILAAQQFRAAAAMSAKYLSKRLEQFCQLLLPNRALQPAAQKVTIREGGLTPPSSSNA